MDDAIIEAIVAKLLEIQDQENVNIPLYERELRETNISIENMLNAIQQGILTRSTKERLEALEKTRDNLENKLACEKLAKPRYTAEQLTFFFQRFRKLDMTQQFHRKMLIDTFVNAIFLYDDKLMLGLNFHEGTATITFDDLQKAVENEAVGSDTDSVGAPNRKPRLWRGFYLWLFIKCWGKPDSQAKKRARKLVNLYFRIINRCRWDPLILPVPQER